MVKTIIVRGVFPFVHCYPGAPEPVAYLRNPHRHLFNYEVEIQVHHSDRDLEFILVKQDLDEFIRKNNSKWPVVESCETLAERLHIYLVNRYGDSRKLIVTVFEDNENGGRVQ